MQTVRVVKDELDKRAEKIVDELVAARPPIPEENLGEVTGMLNMRGQPTRYSEEIHKLGRPIYSYARLKRDVTTKRRSLFIGARKPINEERYPDTAFVFYHGTRYGDGWFLEQVKRPGDNDWKPFTGWNKEEKARIEELNELGKGIEDRYTEQYGVEMTRIRRPGLVKSSKQIVLEHLDSRPIICDSEESANAEARAVGKQLNATTRINEGKF